MLLGLLLARLVSPALAAESWTATCPTKDDPSVWFVLTSAPDAAPLPDYDCKGLFFDSTVSCTQTVALGKIRPSGQSPGGIPLLELRYLPYGDKATILTFLSQPGGGVLYKPPASTATTPAAQPPPATATDLLRTHLLQRKQASAATKNTTLHVWTCPGVEFTPPTDAIEPFGMKLQQHVGKVSLY